MKKKQLQRWYNRRLEVLVDLGLVNGKSKTNKVIEEVYGDFIKSGVERQELRKRTGLSFTAIDLDILYFGVIEPKKEHLDLESIEVGQKIGTWDIKEKLGNDLDDHCLCVCRKCKHERKWKNRQLIRVTNKVQCEKCARLNKAKRRVGLTFGIITVIGVRPVNKDNTFIECECGTVGWKPWSIVNRSASCGCLGGKKKATTKELTLAQIKEDLDYNPKTGVLIRKSTGYVLGGSTVKIDGRNFAIERICWWIATGKRPKNKVTGKSLKFRYLISVPSKDRLDDDEVGCGVVVQPKSESNKMRMSTACFKDGMCINYKICGDNLFRGDCLGLEIGDNEPRYNMHGSPLANAI